MSKLSKKENKCNFYAPLRPFAGVSKNALKSDDLNMNFVHSPHTTSAIPFTPKNAELQASGSATCHQKLLISTKNLLFKKG